MKLCALEALCSTGGTSVNYQISFCMLHNIVQHCATLGNYKNLLTRIYVILAETYFEKNVVTNLNKYV